MVSIRPFENYLENNGIVFQHPCPHAHEQNEKVERKHKHIIKMELTFLVASMPLRFRWGPSRPLSTL